MDQLISFTEEKLAVFAIALLLLGMIARLFLFARTWSDGAAGQEESRLRYAARTFGRALLPLHTIAIKKPAYTALRYLFHICLLLVLVGTGSHLGVLKSLHLAFLRALPGLLVDRATVVLICCLAYFLVRKVVFKPVREGTSRSEGLFVCMATLPIVSGYVAHHGWLDYETAIAVHMLSGIVLVVGTAFLFCRTTVATEKCTGCRACSVSCPTGALKTVDKGRERVFEYSHYQCVCCATCVRSCPEGAVTMRHRLGFRYAIEYHRVPERVMPLQVCEQCGQTFTSYSQVDQIDILIKAKGLELSNLGLCERCKRRSALAWLRPAQGRIG
jgi:ferredoxin